ncbi:MAG: hypothetical protein KDA62_22655, partial [Planctomycetales bacterium]|nr:hypothetical protein [Planctomycetales bacterium]
EPETCRYQLAAFFRGSLASGACCRATETGIDVIGYSRCEDLPDCVHHRVFSAVWGNVPGVGFEQRRVTAVKMWLVGITAFWFLGGGCSR